MLSFDELSPTGPGGLTLGTTLLSTAGSSTLGVTLDHATAGTLKIRTLTNSADAALSAGNITASGTFTYGGVTLSSAVTGTGSLVGSVSPSITGTATFEALTATGAVTANSSVVVSSLTATTQNFIQASATSNLGLYFGSGTPSFTAAAGSFYLNVAGSSTSTRAFVRSSAATWIAVTTAS